MNPHPPIIPPGQHPLSALPAVEDSGRHFAAAQAHAAQLHGFVEPIRDPEAAPLSTLNPQLSTAPPPAFDPTAALQQLATLDTFAAAVAKARSLGGPTAALQALIQRPVKVGPFTLHKVSVFTFLFLQAIKSPFVVGGTCEAPDIARALVAFTDPEEAGIYLDFHGTDVLVDWTQLNRDAWRLAAAISGPDLAAAVQWITAQVAGIEQLLPAGEEAGNFPTPEGTSPPPETAASPAPPAGSLSSSIS
jgi:hypothetical protein